MRKINSHFLFLSGLKPSNTVDNLTITTSVRKDELCLRLPSRSGGLPTDSERRESIFIALQTFLIKTQQCLEANFEVTSLFWHVNGQNQPEREKRYANLCGFSTVCCRLKVLQNPLWTGLYMQRGIVLCATAGAVVVHYLFMKQSTVISIWLSSVTWLSCSIKQKDMVSEDSVGFKCRRSRLTLVSELPSHQF